MPLDVEEGAKVLQLVTARYDQREWRRKIEKTLSLPPSGFEDDTQRKIFVYLKVHLQAYKSRRADPPSWIVGGHATKEVIDRARFRPTDVDPTLTETEVALLGVDPGAEVDHVWWDDMLVKWFETPEEETEESEASDEDQVDQEISGVSASREGDSTLQEGSSPEPG